MFSAVLQVVFVLTLFAGTDGQGTHVCVQIDACTCQFEDDQTIVDITSLGRTDNVPRFKDIVSPDDGFVYSYNPCQPFNEQSCLNASVCKMDAKTGESLNIGYAAAAQFTYDEILGDTVLGYSAGSMGEIKTFVYLLCEPSAITPRFYPNGTSAEGNLHLLTIWSVCACPGMCSASGPISQNDDGQDLGISTIVLIGVASVILLYLVFGSVFMATVKKARGKDIIPNVTMWKSFGGLIKDGTMFVLSKPLKKASYDKV